MKDIYKHLAELGVAYKKHDHVAVFTNEESEKLGIGAVAENTKNLFLADDKNQRFYLLTIQHGKRADLKKFAGTIGERKIHFANEGWLKQLLNLTPGSVTPLGLLYDNDHRVKFYIDSDLLKQDKIYVHPDINTATLEIPMQDFKKVIESSGHTINIAEI